MIRLYPVQYQIPGAQMILFRDGHGTAPVSYTHLDVYKRQLFVDNTAVAIPAHHKRFSVFGNHCDFPPFLAFEIFEFVNVVNLSLIHI